MSKQNIHKKPPTKVVPALVKKSHKQSESSESTEDPVILEKSTKVSALRKAFTENVSPVKKNVPTNLPVKVPTKVPVKVPTNAPAAKALINNIPPKKTLKDKKYRVL